MPENVTEDATHPTWEGYGIDLTNGQAAYYSNLNSFVPPNPPLYKGPLYSVVLVS